MISMLLRARAASATAARAACPALAARRGARWLTTTTVPILFGSQTGTAKMMARQLAREAKSNPAVNSRGVTLKAVSLAAMTPEELADYAHAVFITATYGQGEPTDNAKDFFGLLKASDKGPAVLSKTNVAIFGLGSSKTYPQRYQAFSRALERELVDHGAKQLVARGEGDDSGDIEADFIRWKEQMLPVLLDSCAAAIESGRHAAGEHMVPDAAGATSDTAEAADAADTSRDVVKLVDPRCLVHFPSTDVSEPDDPALRVFTARVTRNDELYPNSDTRSARHIELRVPPDFVYETGDHLAVLPHNHPLLVYQFAATVLGPDYHLHKQLDWLLKVPTSGAGSDLVPMWDPSHGALCGMSLRELLTSVVDLSGPVTRSTLQALAECATDAAEGSALADLASLSNARQFDELVVRRRQRLVDVFASYPSVRLPLGTALELLPRLEPRYYSISSAAEKHGHSVHLTVTVLRQEVADATLPFEGCCSGYLARRSAVAPTSVVRVRHRPANFRLPATPGWDAAPVVMVGAGSGIAPLRAHLHRLSALKAQGRAVPRATLYFGCRHEHSEFPYREELAQLAQEGVLAEVVTAFSHDQPQLVFVQHRMAQRAEQLWRQLHDQRGVIMVCGDGATLAVGINDALVDIAVQQGGLSQEQAKQWIKQLHDEGRYLEDVFTNASG